MISIVLKEGEYISNHKETVLDAINTHKRVLIDSNPGSGKTTLFVEFACDIIQGKRKGRLVFCAPYIIIQSQFVTSLKSKGYKVDLFLNHQSLRKNLEVNDKIITSTYQSLWHIIDELTQEDTIVLDEAHAFSYSFLKNHSSRTYFNKEVGIIFNSKAKIVLMSGTANVQINKLLGLTSIVVKSTSVIQAKINLSSSTKSALKLAVLFAHSAIKEFGKDALNIIYIKNTKECENIKDAILQLGFKAIVLTSHHKKEDNYQKLVQKMVIDKDVQFLVCTNVISTGTNINNENIGGALMINESNPQEIKQFAKRFRKKPDIEVDVVNTKSEDLSEENNSNIDSKILKNLPEVKTIISAINHIKSSDLPNHYNNSLDVSDLGTKQSLIQELIDRYIIQVCYQSEYNAQKCLNTNILHKELEVYDDILPIINTKILTVDKGNIIDDNDAYTKLLTSISNAFIQKKEAFAYEIKNGKSVDYYYKEKFELLTSEEITPKQGKVIKWVENPYFERKVLVPSLDVYPFVKSLPKSIFIANNYLPREINKLELKLYVNSFINNNLELDRKITKFSLKLKDEVILDETQQILFSIIKIIFNYCLTKDNIPLGYLKDYLDDKFSKKHKLKSDKITLKFLMNSNGSFSKEYLSSLLESIFYCKTRKNKKIQPDGKEKFAIIFEEDYPDKLKLSSLSYGKDYQMLIHSQRISLNKTDSSFDVPELLFKIIPNSSLLLYTYLSPDYYILV